jgi:hypothetical protein
LHLISPEEQLTLNPRRAGLARKKRNDILQHSLTHDDIYIMDKADVLKIAAQKAEQHEIDLDLILAFITTESNFNVWAHRFEPQWHYSLPDEDVKKFAAQNGISIATERIDQATSFSVMQVMGSVARELGYAGNLAGLYDPEYGIHYGCLKLKLELKKYPELTDAISSYNQGSPRRAGGMYENQDYVDRVLNVYKGLKAKGN